MMRPAERNGVDRFEVIAPRQPITRLFRDFFGPQASSARRVVPGTPQTASTTRSINSETSSSSRPDLSNAEPTSPHAILLLRPVPQRGATPKTLVVTASPATEARHDLSATPERQATPGRGAKAAPARLQRVTTACRAAPMASTELHGAPQATTTLARQARRTNGLDSARKHDLRG